MNGSSRSYPRQMGYYYPQHMQGYYQQAAPGYLEQTTASAALWTAGLLSALCSDPAYAYAAACIFQPLSYPKA